MGTGTSGTARHARRVRHQGLPARQPARHSRTVRVNPPSGEGGQGLQGGRCGGEADKGDNQAVERERQHHRGDRLCP